MAFDRLRCLDAILKISKSTWGRGQSAGLPPFWAPHMASPDRQHVYTASSAAADGDEEVTPFLLRVRRFFSFLAT